jgi:hypothetical protein
MTQETGSTVQNTLAYCMEVDAIVSWLREAKKVTLELDSLSFSCREEGNEFILVQSNQLSDNARTWVLQATPVEGTWDCKVWWQEGEDLEMVALAAEMARIMEDPDFSFQLDCALLHQKEGRTNSPSFTVSCMLNTVVQKFSDNAEQKRVDDSKRILSDYLASQQRVTV